MNSIKIIKIKQDLCESIFHLTINKTCQTIQKKKAGTSPAKLTIQKYFIPRQPADSRLSSALFLFYFSFSYFDPRFYRNRSLVLFSLPKNNH